MPGIDYNIDLVYGPMLVGVLLNCILFGVMVMQTFIYYQTYTKDKTWIRWFIGYLFVVEVLNTCCDIYLIYQPLVQEFGSVAAVTYFPMMLAATPIITVSVSTPVQIFTAWRISVVSQSKKIAAIICILAVISYVGGLWVTVQVVTFKLYARKGSFIFTLPGIIWFVASAFADMIITGTLVFSLSTRKTGHSNTDLSVNRIIRLTIQTGFITMLFAIADLLLFTLSPKTAVSFVWDFPLSKLYTNALLSTLNARAGWNNLSTNEQDQGSILFRNDTNLYTTQPTKSFHNATGTRNDITLDTSLDTAADTADLQPIKFRRHLSASVDKDVGYHTDSTTRIATQ
jgi:hypothetical protein